MGQSDVGDIGPTRGYIQVGPHLKKSLFPVQRVAEIMASRAAAKKKKNPVFL